jgi:hypothetical protein
METENRVNLLKAAGQRKQDAQVLLEKQRWRGAMYLGGYAIECKLKAQLLDYYACENLSELSDVLERRFGVQPQLTTVRGHGLEYIFGFQPSCRERLRQNREREQDFGVCNRWQHSWRYWGNAGREADATYFLECVDRIFQWLSQNI